MSIFAPIYRPAKGQQTHLAEQQRLQRKRKRGSEDDAGDSGQDVASQKSSPTPEATPRTASTAFHHPVNRTDQYYVAGHPREEPVPLPPFPHAAVLSTKREKTIDEELAGLNPPIYVPKAQPDDATTSLKRRHIDNLTTLLHTCMLRGDWQRASRAWALLLRTEIGGQGMDVRQNGRWAIGAELLMRRSADHTDVLGQIRVPQIGDAGNEHEDQSLDDEQPLGLREQHFFTDEGFKLARQYYERLILQYPHTPYSKNSINALAFYPALFNIWVYEVQDRSKRARSKANSGGATSPICSQQSLDQGSNESNPDTMVAARKRELDEGLPIADRMDELLLSPPYDTSLPLLRLRGMVGLWLSDLFAKFASPSTIDEELSASGLGTTVDARQYKQQADAQRERAVECLKKVKAAGGDLPVSIDSLFESGSSELE